MVLSCLMLAAASFLKSEDYQVFDEETLFNRLHYKEKIRYNGLQYILNDHQKRHYLSLETWDERDEWLRKFWLEMDPTPTTRHNERRKEHFDRVKMAVEKYGCSDPPGWDDRGEVLIRFGPPDRNKESVGGDQPLPEPGSRRDLVLLEPEYARDFHRPLPLRQVHSIHGSGRSRILDGGLQRGKLFQEFENDP